ncbi:MAG TPA: bifunctional oligoribonuclease/PAP phosphatase NrnA [Mycobacteriales bacterium]|nr:bifunctional oligoribonuclease/PAP phosphatase NrnA [Mycobacteriales bacterium]
MTAATALSAQTWTAAVDLLSRVGQATLVCHVAPDGDALGSMLGLARVLRARGLDVTCTWGDARWSVPSTYRWLPDIDLVVHPDRVAPDPELLVVLDTGSRDRLGVLAPLADTARHVLVIDHHAHNSGLSGVQLVDTSAAATALIVTELVERLHGALDAETATLLYVGVVTDTGSFQHSVTTPEVHLIASRLLAAGAQPDGVAQQLWGSRPFGYVQVLAAALERVRLEPDAASGRGLVWTWTTQDDLDAAGIGIEEIEPVIDVIRSTQEADVAAIFKQDVDRSFRVSTRSRGGTDVGAACAALGGGGHKLAAGFTAHSSVDETAELLRAALEEAPSP